MDKIREMDEVMKYIKDGATIIVGGFWELELQKYLSMRLSKKE